MRHFNTITTGFQSSQCNYTFTPTRSLEEIAKEQKEIYGNNGLLLSFGWTKDRLLSGQKTQTRRDWSPNRLPLFQQYYTQKRVLRAIDKQMSYGGKQIGWIQLTEKPYYQAIADFPDGDQIKEGYPELSKEEFINKFFSKLEITTQLVVINFKFVSL